MRLNLICFLLFFSIQGIGQVQKFVVVTIQKETSSKLHKSEIDYWIISRSMWADSSAGAVMPLYMYGFSTSDFRECCEEKSLVLFNQTVNEDFTFDKEFQNSHLSLQNLIASKRRKVQTIRKEWALGYTEKYTIYITPINGSFCSCMLVHKDGNEKLGYTGKTLVPLSGFHFDPAFWDSQEAKQIGRFDFGKLPFLALHHIQ